MAWLLNNLVAGVIRMGKASGRKAESALLCLLVIGRKLQAGLKSGRAAGGDDSRIQNETSTSKHSGSHSAEREFQLDEETIQKK